MNELISDGLPTASFSDISMAWLLVVAAFVTLFSLFEAWLATFILYAKVTFLKRLFPASHNLIRSHVDYLMMASLLGVIYFACLHLHITLPDSIIVILCIGALYNPFGFVIKSMNPNAGNSDTFLGKLMVCVGFLPATIGFGYSMFAVLQVLLR